MSTCTAQTSRMRERQMKQFSFLFLTLGVVATIGTAPLMAQTAISAGGVVESTSGGLKFPDGTEQATASAGNVALVPDTGQTGCWDSTGVSHPCAGTGEDGDYQAGVAWPTPRFTDNPDGTVTDNLTGLIWLQDANCWLLSAGGEPDTWANALTGANTLSSGICGLIDGSAAGDWRLPNIKELLSLVDYGQTGPALPSGHPFVNVQSSFYWSSSSSDAGYNYAWSVGMSDGFAATFNKAGSSSVGRGWPVRGGQ